MSEAVRGPVLVVGAGLLGTSIGLALHRQGVEVWLRDVNGENVRTASGLSTASPSPRGASGPWSSSRCPPTWSARRSRGR